MVACERLPGVKDVERHTSRHMEDEQTLVTKTEEKNISLTRGARYIPASNSGGRFGNTRFSASIVSPAVTRPAPECARVSFL